MRRSTINYHHSQDQTINGVTRSSRQSSSDSLQPYHVRETPPLTISRAKTQVVCRSMYLMIERWKRYWPKDERMIPRFLYVSIHITYVSWHVLSWNINVIKAAPFHPTGTLCIESKRSRLGCAWHYSRLQSWVITVKGSLEMEKSMCQGVQNFL